MKNSRGLIGFLISGLIGFLIVSQFNFAIAQTLPNALPTGGKVVAGNATISQTQTANSATMNINQTSQRAVVNWDSFNVGKNAQVNFNQPNASAVTLNRVTGATQSMIDGAVNANGQVVFVNPNGVTFGKGAEINAGGVVATTMDIANKDFMDGKSTYKGNGKGVVVNEGKISTNDPNGYIALLAPEVRNEGYLLAKMGPDNTVAMASGKQVTLDFRGDQLMSVTIDRSVYQGLVDNKRVVEAPGGLIIVAAGAANRLMGSVVKNTGRITASSMVNNGGVIELVANTVTQAGTVSANGNGAGTVGGQINIVAENVTLAANSKTTATGKAGGGTIEVGVGRTLATNVAVATPANAAAAQTATQILASNPQATNLQAKTVTVEEGASVNASAIAQGNGGAIVIWSQVKTAVNGVLSAVGGYLNGNGGLVETSSAGTVVLGKNLSVTTAAPKGKSGLWFLDPIDLTIDGSAANVISAALTNNSVSIAVNGNVCPSLGSCTQNGTGSLTIASGANILKESGNLTTLTLTSTGIFNLNADISGQNLNVIINSSIAYLNVGTTINANQVTVQAQTVYSYGTINAGNSSNLGSAIQLLASAIYVSGGLQVGNNLANSTNSSSSSNTVSYNGTLIRREDLPNYLAAANQTSVNLDQVYSTIAANQSSYNSTATNQISLTGTQSISISGTAQILANGTFGGSIIASAPQISILAPSQNNAQIAQGSGSLIQANGNNGPGGIIVLTAANDFNINSATISANGSTDGGSIRLITSAGNLLLANTLIQTNGSAGPGGTITISTDQDIQVNSIQITANGSTDGGSIRIMSRAGSLSLFDSLIQTNGSNGRGGSIGISAFNQTILTSTAVEASGFIQGGTILIGNDANNSSLPFSIYTSLDALSTINASQTNLSNTTAGGFIETSGHTLNLLASINAGRGGMWLIDPSNVTVDASYAATISSSLNAGTNVLVTSDTYINIASSIGANSNANLTFSASSYIWIYSGVNIWLNSTSSATTGTYTPTSNTGSLLIGGPSISSLVNISTGAVDSAWKTNSAFYANGGYSSGGYLAGIYVGTGGTAQINAGNGSVVLAGANYSSLSGCGFAGSSCATNDTNIGVIVFSGSTISAQNVYLFSQSSGSVGTQIGYGGSAASVITASNQISVYAQSSSATRSGNYYSNAVFTNGSTWNAPTISIAGYSLNGSVYQSGIALGWYNTPGAGANSFTTDNFLLTTDRLTLGSTAATVSCRSACSSFNLSVATATTTGTTQFLVYNDSSSTSDGISGLFGFNKLSLPSMTLGAPYSSYLVTQPGAITIGTAVYATMISLTTLGQMNINANLIASASGGTVNLSAGNFNASNPTITATNVNISETSVTSLASINTNWINGYINLNNNGSLRLTTPASSYFVLTAAIAGTGGTTAATVTMTASNQGTIQFGGQNTYTGVTTISGGTYVNSYGACATNATCYTNSYFQVNDGGTFQFIGNSYFYANAASGGYMITANSGGIIDLNGITVSDAGVLGYGIKLNGGTLTNTSSTAAIGNFTYANGLYFSANSNIGGSNGNITLSGSSAGPGGLSKVGTNTVTLSGSNAYTGTTSIDGGTLKLSGGSAISNSSAVVLANTSGVYLDLNGSSETIGSLAGGGSTGGIITNSAASTSVILSTGTDNTSTSFAGAIQDGGSGKVIALTKQGTGTLTLSGANTYTGGTTVNNGTLQAGRDTSGTVSNGPFGAGRVTVNSGATVDLNGKTIANALTLYGTGYSSNGALYNSSSAAATASGAITLAADTTIKNVGNLTISNTINGAYGLTLTTTSTGTVTLSSALGASTNLASLTTNASSGSAGITISGGSIITTGAMNFGNPITLSTAVTTTLNAGAAVTLGGTLAGGGNALTITNNAVINGAITNVSVLQVGGTTTLGAAISTTGNQTYTGAVVLSADAILTATNNSNISFGSTVNSISTTPYLLQLVNGTGTSTFASSIGATNALASLTTSTGTTSLAGNVTTSGRQAYGGNIQLVGDVSLNTTNSSVSIAGNVTVVDVANILQFTGGGAYILNGTTVPDPGAASYSNRTLSNAGTLSWDGSAYTWTANATISGAQLLVVGGGGGGGNWGGSGGGGGGGAVVSSNTVNLSSGSSYSVQVGSGGLVGSSGGTSSFGSILSAAGGSGGSLSSGNGGASGDGTPGGTSGIYGSGGGYIYNGGGRRSGSSGSGGSNDSGAGGSGTLSSITGSSIYYGGGGGGGYYLISGGAGGNGGGGGGAGQWGTPTGGNGTNNLGGGGGGNAVFSGGSGQGGSGLVVLNYSSSPRALVINSGSGQVTIGGSSAVSGGISITSTNTANAISGDISGATSITYAGTANTGRLSLSGNNSQTGTTTISSGAINAVSANAFGTGAVSIGSSGVLDLRYAGTVALGSTLNMSAGGSITNSVNTSNLSVSSTSTLAGNITTSGTQLYSGAVTLSGADRTLTGTTITTNGITGGSNGLTITGAGVFNGAVTGVTNLSVSSTSTLAGNITTSGTQLYSGAVTLSGADRTLTGTTITTNGITGGSNGLTITGAGVFNGAVTGVTNLSVSSTSTLAGNITTSGTQLYSGAVTLSGADRTLTGTTITTNGITGGSNGLTITGAGVFNGAVTGVTNLSVSSTSTLAGNITTSGTQLYSGAVTLSGADRTLTGTTITTNGITGGSNGLTITGAGVFNGAVTGVTNLSVSGSSSLGGDITTTGTQQYTGPVTLTGTGATRTLQGSAITIGSTLAGGENSLTITGNLVTGGAITDVTNLSVSGSSSLGGDITTSGTQGYSGPVTLSGTGTTRTLQGTSITTSSTIAGGANALTITGNAIFGGAITNVTNLSVSGTTSIAADITTTGIQGYSGAVTLTGTGATRTLQGSAITIGSTLAGGANSLTITGNLVTGGA
ncbi:filamentous hemagglutinin N-terminal domain-containing protein, partial [Polynucleobacter nymphae]|uniref:filamentous hemagglutinin N-terminal domain-containing protein n=1 Tax=Polynucleobacter nymphae TaxID=2081043 RepID=UPI001C0D5155|nr:filamentous hemagglutinin N-terminal domain-containing protein [Polynucleobacter nymphae]